MIYSILSEYSVLLVAVAIVTISGNSVLSTIMTKSLMGKNRFVLLSLKNHINHTYYEIKNTSIDWTVLREQEIPYVYKFSFMSVVSVYDLSLGLCRR